MRILVPFGTRPEIIKLSPIISALAQAKHDVTVIATGQHYDPDLTQVFYDELGVRPQHELKCAAGPHTVARVLDAAIDLIADGQPDLVLVLGDTHTVPAFAIAARNARIPVAHLEAGLRSFNETSVEEVNRRIVAACASVHLAPTELAARLLLREGHSAERVFVVGNPVLDVLRAWDIRKLPPRERHGVVVTAHRATNVDNAERLRELVRLVRSLIPEFGEVTFPVHPRTAQRLSAAGLWSDLETAGVILRPPLAYREMLAVLQRSRLVVTDSGGLQEEAAWLGLPVVVLRHSTPRWESVVEGTSVLTGLQCDRALTGAIDMNREDILQRVFHTSCPYGDGHTSIRVVDVLSSAQSEGLLEFREPPYAEAGIPTFL